MFTRRTDVVFWNYNYSYTIFSYCFISFFLSRFLLIFSASERVLALEKWYWGWESELSQGWSLNLGLWCGTFCTISKWKAFHCGISLNHNPLWVDGKEQEGKEPAINAKPAVAAKLKPKCFFSRSFLGVFCFIFKRWFLWFFFLLSFLALCSLT